jgi:thioredoxin-related protein
MKRITLPIVLVFFAIHFSLAQETDHLNWIADFNQAKAIAKKENKPILIFFTGSDWCGLCKLLDKDFFASEEFKKLADEKLVLYKADFPRRTDLISQKQKEMNQQLDKKYSKSRRQRVFPTIVLIDKNGKELSFLESYNYIHDTSRHYKMLDFILNDK